MAITNGVLGPVPIEKDTLPSGTAMGTIMTTLMDNAGIDENTNMEVFTHNGMYYIVYSDGTA